MRTSVPTTVKHKDGREIKVVVHHYDEVEYDRAQTRHGAFSWYDRKDVKEDDVFQPRGFVADESETQEIDVHLVKLDVDVLGHELLHVMGHDHPNTFFGGVMHAIKCKLNLRAFTGLLRWQDTDNIRPKAAYIIARLKEQGAK